MTGTYNALLVALSFFVAILAGYCVLELGARTQSSTGRARHFWLAGGALAAGTGIWSMHFVGMLAFRLPIPIGFDITLTALSWLLPVAASWLALLLVQQQAVKAWQWGASALLMGGAIAGMHYVGMAAMRMVPAIQWDFYLVALSIAIAVALSGVALWAMRKVLLLDAWGGSGLKAGVALILGAAIFIMHYTGMWAARFPAGAICTATDALSGAALPWVVGATSILLLVAASTIAYLDRRRIEHCRIAETDALTGLRNRRFLQFRLPECIRQVERNGSTLQLAFIDLDEFKLVNDSVGHDTGDKVLVMTAERLRDCLQAGEEVIRVGGDEFIMIFRSLDRLAVEQRLSRILSVIQSPLRIGNETLRVSASIGLAEHARGVESQALLMMSDTAMYAAKRAGKNRWVRFTPDMDAERLRVADVHRRLMQAFEHGEFQLFYQPKFSAVSRDIVSAEALVRWVDPENGLRKPDDFMGIAERTGLVVILGDWVVDEACRQMRAWRERGWRMPVAINVSVLQMRGDELTARIKDALRRHHVEPRQLTLEVTESAGITDRNQAISVFNALRDYGVSISIDDFGTGYSSLTYLMDFGPAEIKIDRSFVRRLTSNNKICELVRSVISMGHALGMVVVAEGVEDEETADRLERLGCDLLQGYHLGAPMPAADFTRLLEAGFDSARLPGNRKE